MSLLPDKLHSQWERWNRNAPHLRARAAALRDSRPKVGYIGWQGHGNLGDDAMFEAALRLLPHCRLIPVVTGTDEHFLKRFQLSGPRYFDAVIMGGGTLINPAWIPWIAPFIECGVPAYALGTGVGSVGFEQPDDISVSVWKPYLEQFRAVGVRGPRSLATLRTMGFHNAEIVGDLALGLAAPERAPPGMSDAPPRVLLNLSLPQGQEYGEGDYAAFHEVASFLRAFLREGGEIAPVAMFPTDVAPLERCLAQVSVGAAPVAQPATAAEFFRIAQRCRFAITVRLHAAILSCCVGVPPLMLGYRSKCLDFMETVNLLPWHIALGSAEASATAARCRNLYEAAPSLRPEIGAAAQGWQKILQDYSRRQFADCMGRGRKGIED